MCGTELMLGRREPTIRAMTDYVVVDASASTRRVGLLDRFGCYHVAQVSDAVPPIGVSLIGTHPTAGARVLVAVSSGDVYRVTFDAADFSSAGSFASPALE
jgi:hypothetical protein